MPGLVAGSPQAYRDYIRRSRGEFSCAKPSCMRFQNAWVSDRTLCYLASGRPVVARHCRAARELAESAFDSRAITARILEIAAS